MVFGAKVFPLVFPLERSNDVHAIPLHTTEALGRSTPGNRIPPMKRYFSNSNPSHSARTGTLAVTKKMSVSKGFSMLCGRRCRHMFPTPIE